MVSSLNPIPCGSVKIIFFSHKYWHLLFQNCIQYALRNFLRCITCLYVKNWRCWNSFHIRLIFEFPQPRGCFWRGCATQEADQELRWKLRAISIWDNWVMEASNRFDEKARTQWQNMCWNTPIYLAHLPKSANYLGYFWKKPWSCQLSMFVVIELIKKCRSKYIYVKLICLHSS